MWKTTDMSVYTTQMKNKRKMNYRKGAVALYSKVTASFYVVFMRSDMLESGRGLYKYNMERYKL